MYRFFTLFLSLILATLAAAPPLEAMGRRGGGRQPAAPRHISPPRGGTNFVRTPVASPMNRSPSMSRMTAPARSSFPNGSHRLPVGRPSVVQHPAPQRPTQAHPLTTTQVQRGLDYLRSKIPPKRLPLHSSNGNLQNHMHYQQGIGDQIRHEVQQQRRNKHEWFHDGFWARHGVPLYGQRGANWWPWTNWNGLIGWLGWDAVPFYYDGDDTMYQIDDSSLYAQEAASPLPSASDINVTTDTGEQWLPLGVFALSLPQTVNLNPNMYLQLALKKEGTLYGTFYNATSDQTFPVIGLVDKQTQLAQWKLAHKDDSPVAETALYNLTQDQAPVNIHFPNGQAQTWLMTRIKDNG